MIKTEHPFVHTLLFACALIAFTGSVKAEIVHCVDESGSVLITDVACSTGADAVHVPDVVKKSSVKIKVLSQVKRFSDAEHARAVASKYRKKDGRRFPLDVATSQAAKASMLSIDQASALEHQQALEEQAARPGIWEFWHS